MTNEKAGKLYSIAQCICLTVYTLRRLVSVKNTAHCNVFDLTAQVNVCVAGMFAIRNFRCSKWSSWTMLYVRYRYIPFNSWSSARWRQILVI